MVVGERDHENLREDVLLKYQAVLEPKFVPCWMNNPAYQQLMTGNFLDILLDHPYEIHNYQQDAAQNSGCGRFVQDSYKKVTS